MYKFEKQANGYLDEVLQIKLIWNVLHMAGVLVLKTLRQVRNHGFSAVRLWRCQLLSRTGRYCFSGLPAAGLLPRTLSAPQQCHCMQIPAGKIGE